MMSASIVFCNADVDFVLRDKTLLRKWMHHCAHLKKRKIFSLTYVFCSDPYLRKMNRKHLQHDYNTDIITFPEITGIRAAVSGELYISIDRVKANAKEYGVSFSNELRRVMIHGLLHLCGEDDKSGKSAAKMRKAEDASLALFQKIRIKT